MISKSKCQKIIEMYFIGGSDDAKKLVAQMSPQDRASAANIFEGLNRLVKSVTSPVVKRPRRKSLAADWSKGVWEFSVEKASEGGESFKDLKARLEDAGIPARKGYSPFVGQYGIQVPKEFSRKAEDIIWPGR